MANPNSMDSHVEDDKDWEPVQLASLGQRIANMFLDLGFFYLFSAILGAVLGLLGLAEVVKQANPYVLGSLLIAAYYIPQEWLTGRTLGKLITGTQAINDDGKDLTLLRAIGRTLCRFIPLEFISFVFPSPDGPKGWHDRIPKTLVITLRKTEKPSSTTWQS